MEEGEEIGMFLARASELRSKFTDCIDQATLDDDQDQHSDEEEESEEEEEGKGGESLVNIRDAFDSLEQQLSALLALQQQQRYEREASLVQIGRSRMVLLSKLKEYKGDKLDVIQEALTFADRTLRLDDDLFLPPYPSHLPDLFVLDDLYSSKHKIHQCGSTGEAKETINGTSNEPSDKKRLIGIRHALGLVGKSALVVAGFVCVLSLSGFSPMIRKDEIQLKMQQLFQKIVSKGRRVALECPPGKVMVVEDGKARCIVKERVEMPFDLDVTAPKISYGLG